MTFGAPTSLHARKTPLQARAAATLEAIFAATIQVLLADGHVRMTTTRVAERAGVSVGTLYQYFPNKRALLYAVTKRYLDDVAEAMERTCADRRGASLREIADALVTTYSEAKTRRCDVTKALYVLAADVGTADLAEDFARRVERATLALLTSARDARFADPGAVNLTLLTSIFGTIRVLFERDLLPFKASILEHLAVMCRAYLEAKIVDRNDPVAVT